MNAAQRLDPFNKVFGGNSNSDLLNAILSLALLVLQGGGVSMNKRSEFSIFNSKAGANKNVRRPPPNHAHVDDDHAEPGRKTKGFNAGSANLHNMNEKNSRKRSNVTRAPSVRASESGDVGNRRLTKRTSLVCKSYSWRRKRS